MWKTSAAALLSFLVASPVSAEIVTLSTYVGGSRTDGPNFTFVTMDTLAAGGYQMVETSHGAVMQSFGKSAKAEFDLSSLAGRTILSAFFQWSDSEFSNTYPNVNQISLTGFTANGLFGELDNWSSGGVGASYGSVADGQADALNSMDVTALMQNLVAGGADGVGFGFSPAAFRYSAYSPPYYITDFTYTVANPQVIVEVAAVPEAGSLSLAALAVAGAGLGACVRRRVFARS